MAGEDAARFGGPPCSPEIAAKMPDSRLMTAPTFDGVDLIELAQRFGTPLQVYSAGDVRARVQSLTRALHGLDALICYAVKANSSHALLKMVAALGAGADIVSGGELERSLRAGIPGERIVFSGVGKTAEEIRTALRAGVGRFNVESADELECLSGVARELGTVACAAVRINPDVDANTHAKISTGRAENKFGVSIDEARSCFAQARDFTHVALNGLHVHIGSQILSLEPFRQALQVVDGFRRELESSGHAISSIDVGGGLGVRYRAAQDSPPDVADYVAVIREALRDFHGRIVLEPGRWLVAEAGILLTRVIRIKQGSERRFLIIDAAMNDLPRPSLYGAWHDIVHVGQASGPVLAYDIVGPVCETGDTFAQARELAECKGGDLLAIKTTGAYSASMASNYNSRPLLAEVMVDGGRHALIRQRQSLDAMIADEVTTLQWISA